MSELKPCPWCGPGNSIVSAWFDTSSNRYRVNCGACGSSSGVPARDKSESAAIAAWNRRAAPAVTDDVALLNLIADIRAAAGDKDGKLMQSELVELIARQRKECDQMRAAESDKRSN